jgi:thymidylate synthase (FAD)
MKVVEQSHEILTEIPEDILGIIEKAGRTCYKSEKNITDDSSKIFVKKIINSGHLSVIEHFNITVKFITDRGITHEIVRHRLASYSQESTRYVNYSGKDISFVKPSGLTNPEAELIWMNLCLEAEQHYNKLIDNGCSPQTARSVLPNCLKTEIIVTANLREWRHILQLRTSKAAHPDIVALMGPLLTDLKIKVPIIFYDI